MQRATIISEIEKRVMSTENKKYSVWTVGITNDTERRKDEHGNPKYWLDWYAESENDVRTIEKHFLDKGMKGDTGGGNTPDYVYIF